MGVSAEPRVNALEGTVAEVLFLGEYQDCRVSVAGAQLTVRQQSELRLQRADHVQIELPPDRLSVLSRCELKRIRPSKPWSLAWPPTWMKPSGCWGRLASWHRPT